MDQKQIAKQMIQFNKTAFDNSFNAMKIVCEQNEKMVGMFLEQATWLPAEGKNAVKEWVGTYKTGFENFKTVADENYAKVEAFFSGTNS